MQGKATLSGSWEHADGVGRSCDTNVRAARTCPLSCSPEPGNFLIQVEHPFCPPPLFGPSREENPLSPTKRGADRSLILQQSGSHPFLFRLRGKLRKGLHTLRPSLQLRFDSPEAARRARLRRARRADSSFRIPGSSFAPASPPSPSGCFLLAS